MKLTSLNLQGFEAWQTRQNAIAQYFHDTRPDIAFFQEVVFLPEISPFNRVQLLNQDLGYPYEASSVTRLQVGIDYPVYREGLAILSNHPIVRSDTLILKQAPGDEHQRIVQLVDIETDQGVMKFANVHFSITDVTDFATAHLRETIELLRDRQERRIIIGDFNLSSLEDSRDLWEPEYRASIDIPYVTFPAENKRIDYALIPRDYAFSSIEVSGDSLSDHRALTVDVVATSQTQSPASHE